LIFSGLLLFFSCLIFFFFFYSIYLSLRGKCRVAKIFEKFNLVKKISVNIDEKNFFSLFYFPYLLSFTQKIIVRNQYIYSRGASIYKRQ